MSGQIHDHARANPSGWVVDRRMRPGSSQPRRVVDVYGALFSRPVTADNMQMSLATGESVAHLNYLVARGEARVSIGQEGCAWYQMV